MNTMPYDIITVSCLDDNYAFIVGNTTTGEATLIDAPEAAPINAALAARRDLVLTTVLLTHHHWDHVDGLNDLDRAHDVTVIGNAADAHRLPALDQTVAPGDLLTILDTDLTIMAACGHTINHIAFYFPALGALFSGDSLMTHGCGRLFEGTPAQMHATLQGFAALPDETQIYSGHDYAQANLDFAARFSPEPQALQQRQSDLNELHTTRKSTTGVSLALEKRLNPYLRVHLPAVKAAAGDAEADDPTTFAAIRVAKDRF